METAAPGTWMNLVFAFLFISCDWTSTLICTLADPVWLQPHVLQTDSNAHPPRRSAETSCHKAWRPFSPRDSLPSATVITLFLSQDTHCQLFAHLTLQWRRNKFNKYEYFMNIWKKVCPFKNMSISVFFHWIFLMKLCFKLTWRKLCTSWEIIEKIYCNYYTLADINPKQGIHLFSEREWIFFLYSHISEKWFWEHVLIRMTGRWWWTFEVQDTVRWVWEQSLQDSSWRK